MDPINLILAVIGAALLASGFYFINDVKKKAMAAGMLFIGFLLAILALLTL